MNRDFIKQNAPLIVLMALTAVGITATAVIYHQQFWRITPLYVSLIIALMQSRMMRAASLLGGLNSILYTVVFFGYSLYGSAARSLLVSFPVQIITFILWSKKPWGQTTVFRRMSSPLRAAVAAGSAAAVAVLAIILQRQGGAQVILDSAITVSGFVTPVLMMLSFWEYAPITAFCCLLQILLYVFMVPEQPELAPYLIFSVYSLICNATAAVRIRKVCGEQAAAPGGER